MKLPIKRSDIFSFLAVCVIWFYFRRNIPEKADEIFVSLFGKTLTGRNLILQCVVFGSLFLICVLIPVILERMMCRNRKFCRIADGLSLLILSVPAYRLLVICANQVLRRDDYWEIADARLYGFPGSIFYEIKQWNGRYTGWSLRSLHAVLPDIPYIDIFLFADLILLTAGVSMLVCRLLRSQPGRSSGYSGIRTQSLVIGFGLSLSFILMSSNIWEFWFWGSGTMIYGFGVSMCIMSIALVLRSLDDGSDKKRCMILPAVSCFLTCGCSELCIASLAAFLLFILLWKRVRTKKWNKKVLFFLAEVLLLTVIIFVVSGSLKYAGDYAKLGDNADSSAVSELTKRLPEIFKWAFGGLQGYTFIKSRLLAVFLCAAFIIGTQFHLDNRSRIQYLIVAVMLTVTAHCVLLINSAVNYMPPRVITVGICWFVTAMALVCVILGSFFYRETNGVSVRIVMIFAALVFSIIMNNFYRDNIDEVRNIRQGWFIRDALLQQKENSPDPVETCSLPCPGSFREDILEDASNDFNKAAARFYKIPSVWAELRCPPYGDYFLP